MADKPTILNTVKKVLGLSEDYNAFDVDIITAINSAFATLQQLGVGPDDGFELEYEDDEQTWDSYSTDPALRSVRSYICDKVRMAFDPPANSFTQNAINDRIKEFEWRLNVAAERQTYK